MAQPVELLELDWRDPAAFPAGGPSRGDRARRSPCRSRTRQLRPPERERRRGRQRHRAVAPDRRRTRQISRWHFELRRAPEGLRLRTLSDGLTTIDGQPVGNGDDVPVRSGTRIGVAKTLTLRLAGPGHTRGGRRGRHDAEKAGLAALTPFTRRDPMKIVEIREKTMPISSPIRNAYIDFSKMTLSLVAVITDVIRDGKPVVGYGFNSNGRYGQGKLMRERFIPRVMEAEPRVAARRRRHEPRSAQDLGDDVHQREARRPRRALGGDRHHRHGGLGRGRPRSKASRCSSCSPTATATASRTARSSSTRPAATTTRARTTASCKDEMRSYIDRGYTVVKKKIGGASLDEDLRRIDAILSVLQDGPEAVRRRQRPLRPRHRDRLRQGARRSTTCSGTRSRATRSTSSCRPRCATTTRTRWRPARTCSRCRTRAT